MSAALAAALAAAAAAAPVAEGPGSRQVLGLGPVKGYGVLLLAYDVDSDWKRELGSLRSAIKGHAVESAACLNIDEAVDVFAVQPAIDRLRGQHVAKIVAIPIETVEDMPRMDETRYLFGVRADPVSERPSRASSALAPKPIKPRVKSTLVVEPDVPRPRRLNSPVPLVLAPTLESSPLLVDMLADRAKALTRTPAREALVLAGLAPRSDDKLKAWKDSAQALAEKVRAKAGFRSAAVAALRDGVRGDQQDADRRQLRETFRGLARAGAITVVPLSPSAARVKQLLDKNPPGAFYRWADRGILGDQRLAKWITTSAEEAAKLPDGRKYKDETPGGLRGLP